MSRLKKKYSNGQSRGGTPGTATFTGAEGGRLAKNYHRQELAFHGSVSAYENWVNGGRKGYYSEPQG